MVRAGRTLRRRVGPDELRSRLPDRAPVAFRAPRSRSVLPTSLLMPTSLVRPRSRARARELRRRDSVRRLVMELGRQDFRRRHGTAEFSPVLVLIASYLEADNIGDVLKAVPSEVDGLAVSTLVVVDGGEDGTEDIVGAGRVLRRAPGQLGPGGG